MVKGPSVVQDFLHQHYLALRTPTKGEPLPTYDRNTRESQRVKGLGSKLSPEENSMTPATSFLGSAIS